MIELVHFIGFVLLALLGGLFVLLIILWAFGRDSDQYRFKYKDRFRR